MGVYRDENKKGYWYCKVNYTNWRGEKLTKKKRGFESKRAAKAWEEEFLNEMMGSLEMSLNEFFSIYEQDRKPRLRLHTWKTKENIARTKILPYLGDLKVSEITPALILRWQTEIMSLTDDKGEVYSPTYLRTIHAQLSSIFNHAVKYYNLKSNPAKTAGSMGEKEASEMDFWTQKEYETFIESLKDKPESYYAFELLYWCGLRTGELLALTKEKFNFTDNTLRINQSLQRLDGKNIITEPKTKKSIRTVAMTDFIAEEMKDYISGQYKIKDTDLLFPFTKSFLHHEMNRGCKKSGVKKIRVHDLRHSHVSLLIELGFSAIAIADRVGHESIDITFRYAHLFPSRQYEMANKLNGLREV